MASCLWIHLFSSKTPLNFNIHIILLYSLWYNFAIPKLRYRLKKERLNDTNSMECAQMHKISRQRTIEGTQIPGIIKNMQYFYINLDVYEDGMVNCWELVDLEKLKEKLRINWLVTSIPNGETISIHGLGSYKIEAANWHYDKKSYYKYIEKTITRLNPKLNNIYTISKEEKELQEKRRISYSPRAKDFYVKNELFYETVDGAGFNIFMKHDGLCYLVNLVVYKDGRIACYSSGFELNFVLNEIEECFSNGTFFTNLNAPTTVILGNFAQATFSKAVSCVEIGEKYKELIDLHSKLNGQKTALEKCREAHYEYLKDPTNYNRKRLQELYELIPKHERRYLGDMDNKDTDYIRIIYHPEEKREV